VVFWTSLLSLDEIQKYVLDPEASLYLYM
jgi:hypothetical protein